MKKNYVSRFGALALALTFITTCMMGSTLARYTSEAVGTGAVAIAKWSPKVSGAGQPLDSANKFTFTLQETKNINDLVDPEAVAPGDTGKIDYEFSSNGSQVDIAGTVKIDTDALDSKIKDAIKFYSDADFKNPIEEKGIETSIIKANATTAETGSIYWRWEPTSTDANDNALGTATSLSGTEFTMTLSAVQVLNTP